MILTRLDGNKPSSAELYLDSSLAIVNKGAGLLSIQGPDTRLSGLSILADFLSGKLRPRHGPPVD